MSYRKETLKEFCGNSHILIENTPDVIFITDLKGNIEFCNKTAAKITGRPLSKLLKSNLGDFVVFENHGSIKNLLRHIHKRKSIPPFEIQVKGPNGRQIPLEVHMKAIKDKEKQIVGIHGIARDITERKKTEEEIKESERKYRNLAENSVVGVYITNLKGNILYVNESLSEMFGFDSPEEMMKEDVLARYKNPQDRDTLLENLRKKGKVNNFELELLTKTGQSKNVILSAALDGNIMSGMMIDNTKRYKAEERIKEMTHQIEKFSEISTNILTIENEEELFERISQAVVDISDFNRVLISYFNDDPPYREIIGYKGIKKTDLKRVKKVPMPKEKYLKYFEKGIKIGNQSCYIPHYLQHILDQKAVIYGEKLYPRKKGHWHREDNLLISMKDINDLLIGIISVDDSKSGLIPTNETVRPLEIFANVISWHIQRRMLARKIKESEEKYRELVSNVKVGIIRATPEGKLLEVNPAGSEMFGYSNSLDFLYSKGVNLYYNPEDRLKYTKEMEEKGMVKNKEFRLKRKDGAPFWASITSTAIRNSTGKIKYYDTVIEDITERKKLEEEVKRLSITDELTGLYNRRYFNQNLPKEIKRAERWKSCLSFIMIDIDDFKVYNDFYHHLNGDKILKEIARVISHNIRKDIDWASRFGGEEFAIILPGTDVSEAFHIAERIRKFFHTIEFKPQGKAVHKTISLGVAQCYCPEDKERTFPRNKKYLLNYEKIATELTSLADQALFKAKNLGKNKVVVSTSSIELSSSLL